MFKVFNKSLKINIIIYQGNDDLVVCSLNGKHQVVEHYHSSSNSTPALIDATGPSIGLTNKSIFVKNGILKCSFNRPINMTDDHFDLHKSYHLIFSNGTILNG